MEAFHLGVRVHLGTDLGVLEPLGQLADAIGTGLADGLYLTTTPAAGGELDPFVVLGALAARSGDARLGELPSTTVRRPPGVLAKLAASLDVISHGRAVAYLGRTEPGSGGVPIDEALEGVRAMLRVPEAYLSASHLHLIGAPNRPMSAGMPIPLGLVIDAAAWTEVDASGASAGDALLALAARFCELAVVELAEGVDASRVSAAVPTALAHAGRLRDDLAVYAQTSAGAVAPSALRAVLAALGASGVVLDVALEGGVHAALETLAALRAGR